MTIGALNPENVKNWLKFASEPLVVSVSDPFLHRRATDMLSMQERMLLTTRDDGCCLVVDTELRDYQKEISQLLTSFATINNLPDKSAIKRATRLVANQNAALNDAYSELDKLIYVDSYSHMASEKGQTNVYSDDGINFRGSKQRFDCALHMEPRQLRDSAGGLRFYNAGRPKYW